MAEVETTEIQIAELTKAEQKKKDAELTPDELMAFGILPPELEKLNPAQPSETVTPDKSVTTANMDGRSSSGG
jgi:hypothetical protein